MPVHGRLSKAVVKAPNSKVQTPEKFQIPRSKSIRLETDPKRRGEDTEPYPMAKNDLIRHGCVGRFVHRLGFSQFGERGEVARPHGLEKCR